MRLFNFINMGGWLNWVLFGLLCFCFCQCLERCLYFKMTCSIGKNYYLKRLEKKAEECKGKSAEETKKVLLKESSLIYYDNNRGLWFLNFTASVAPSIGLLGTVVGLISAFQQMAANGAQVSMQDLSGGIWVAMLTTAFGMMISIPALFFYRTFKRIIEKRMMKIGFFIEEYNA